MDELTELLGVDSRLVLIAASGYALLLFVLQLLLCHARHVFWKHLFLYLLAAASVVLTLSYFNVITLPFDTLSMLGVYIAGVVIALVMIGLAWIVYGISRIPGHKKKNEKKPEQALTPVPVQPVSASPTETSSNPAAPADTNEANPSAKP